MQGVRQFSGGNGLSGDFKLHHFESPAGDGRNEDDLIAFVQGGGPGLKFAVYGRAEAIDGEGEAVLGLQLLVERLGIGGVGVKRLFGLAALFAQDGEIFNRDRFHASLW
jgi:hypothetical protein